MEEINFASNLVQIDQLTESLSYFEITPVAKGCIRARSAE
jgi:hypothetical protein